MNDECNKNLRHQSDQPRQLLLFHMRAEHDFFGMSLGWAGRQVSVFCLLLSTLGMQGTLR